MSFFDEEDPPQSHPKVPGPTIRNTRQRRTWIRTRILTAFAFLLLAVVLISFFAAKITDLDLKVTKTGPNTWHIKDPNNDPSKYINRTCDGKVKQLSRADGDFGGLDVVCE